MKKCANLLFQTALGLIFLCSCDAHRDGSDTHKTDQSNIVAGPNENTFSQKYGLKITLPMKQGDLLAIVDGLHLRWRLETERLGPGLVAPPRWSTALDTSKVSRTYVIEGAYDDTSHVAERYRFYVDGDENVIYIENVFSYPDIG